MNFASKLIHFEGIRTLVPARCLSMNGKFPELVVDCAFAVMTRSAWGVGDCITIIGTSGRFAFVTPI